VGKKKGPQKKGKKKTSAPIGHRRGVLARTNYPKISGQMERQVVKSRKKKEKRAVTLTSLEQRQHQGGSFKETNFLFHLRKPGENKGK